MKQFLKNKLFNLINLPEPSSVISLISKDFHQDSTKNCMQEFFTLADGEVFKDIHFKSTDTNIAKQWVTNPVYSVIMSEVITHIDSGVIFIPNSKKYILETSWGWSKYHTTMLKKYNKNKKKTIESDLPIYVFSGKGFHGVTDDLSSIVALRNQGFKFAIAINKENIWMNNIIDVFFPDLINKKIYIDKDSWILCPKTICVTKSGFGEFTNSYLIKTLNKEARNLTLKNLNYGKIFISRLESKNRSNKFEKNLANNYIDQGYTSLVLSKLSIIDQLSIFPTASDIAGFHGAGFVNIIWANKKQNVKEYFLKNHFNSCFFVLCNYLNHSHSCRSIEML